ncbi:MAG: lysine-2,3-aminomutase-like protein [Alphaproteobacteria bacterium]|nr:lysine-2,3-aminomutase-like protein [Alphaproteobacteria bacterium]
MTLQDVAKRYAVAVSPHVRTLIDPADPADPIARQFLPDVAELTVTADELADPIADEAHSPVKGVVHRHRDRVLLKAVTSCPVYCRFCFRREMVGPGKADPLSPAELAAALAYIKSRPEIWEVILTGGDPFILSPRRMRQITEALAEAGHVKIVRWHTRVPVVEPERVTDDLIAALTQPGLTSWVAIHANHPRELTDAARRAAGRMAEAGIALVSQSVLLKGVNDDAETLEALMRGFVEAGIKPYYLHHPDLARGTSHFRLGIEEGLALTRELRARMSGLAQPTYVLDLPGGFGKVVLDSANVEKTAAGHRIRDFAGNWHAYPPTSAMSQVPYRAIS